MDQRKAGARRKAILALDCLLIFLIAAALVRPLFKAKYTDRWESIESTFVADGRFLNEHWPHPRWQPLWYCGTRFDYIYPPAIRYGTALAARIWIPVKAYHVYTAFWYCMGIAGVYLFVRLMQGSRGAAWIAALATATLSPCYLIAPDWRGDAPWLMPQRLGVLVRYGEGPHMSALALLPLALAFAARALPGKRPASLALAALFSALVVSHNFYGATALAMLFPILVWSVWVTYGGRAVWLRAAGIAALAYGLTAFWLVPSYFRITAENLRLVSEPGNAWSTAVAAAAALAFAAATLRLARGKPGKCYPVFLSGGVLFFALNVLGNRYWGFRVVGEPGRLYPELDLLLILAAAELLRRLWNRGRAWTAAAAALAALAFSPAYVYVTHAWSDFRPDPDYTQRVEYRMADWMARNLPHARALASGSVRFWYNTWHDLAQVGGGSEQGLLNPNAVTAQWEILMGEAPEPAVLWLQALGADAVITHERHSQEVYHDFQHPRKFAGVLPLLHDDGQGNAIYRVPRRFPGLARVVETRRMESLEPPRTPQDIDRVRPYVAAIEQGPDSPASSRWEGTDAMRVRAAVGAGEAVLVQVTHDPAWRAYSAGVRLPVRRDALGFILIEPPPGDHDLRLVFERPLENTIGACVTLASLAAVAALCLAGWRRRARA